MFKIILKLNVISIVISAAKKSFRITILIFNILILKFISALKQTHLFKLLKIYLSTNKWYLGSNSLLL